MIVLITNCKEELGRLKTTKNSAIRHANRKLKNKLMLVLPLLRKLKACCLLLQAMVKASQLQALVPLLVLLVTVRNVLLLNSLKEPGTTVKRTYLRNSMLNFR